MNLPGCTLLCLLIVHSGHYATYTGTEAVASDRPVTTCGQVSDLPTWRAPDQPPSFDSETPDARPDLGLEIVGRAGGVGTGPVELVVRDGRADRDRGLDDEVGGAVLATSNIEFPLDEFDRLRLPGGSLVQVIGTDEHIQTGRYRQTVFVGSIPGPGTAELARSA